MTTQTQTDLEEIEKILDRLKRKQLDLDDTWVRLCRLIRLGDVIEEALKKEGFICL